MSDGSDILFVLTDGGHARLVARSPKDGHYRTLAELDGAPALQAARGEMSAVPPGRSHSRTSPRRSAVGPEDYLRSAKEAFIGEVADRAIELGHKREDGAVVIAAPARLVAPLRRILERRMTVVGAVRKDLTKTPDSQLGAWLNETFTSAPHQR